MKPCFATGWSGTRKMLLDVTQEVLADADRHASVSENTWLRVSSDGQTYKEA